MRESHTINVVTTRMNNWPPQKNRHKHVRTCTHTRSHIVNTLKSSGVFYKTMYVLLYRRFASLSKVHAFSFIIQKLRVFVEGKCVLCTHFKKKLKGRSSSKCHEGRSISTKNISLPSIKQIFLLSPTETSSS